MKKRIVFLGPPGCGKGTQAQIISKNFSLNHISTGEIFRKIIKENNPSEIAEKINSYVKNGLLVPDEIVFEALKTVLDKDNFLLDGFPRNINQAKLLEDYLNGYLLDVVIYFHISEEEIIRRLSSRRTCPKCGRVYNLLTLKPKNDNMCDNCNVELIVREDDKIETIKKRLKVYSEETAPLIEYYKNKGVFKEVDALGSIESVTSRVKEIIVS